MKSWNRFVQRANLVGHKSLVPLSQTVRCRRAFQLFGKAASNNGIKVS
jgi:hypothetical protein